VKLSEQPSKTSCPGVQQVRRFSRADRFVADAIFDEAQGCERPTVLVDPRDPLRKTTLSSDLSYEDLLVPVVRGGAVVGGRTSLDATRKRTLAQLGSLDPTIRRLTNPHEYPVGLTSELFAERARLIEVERARSAVGST
jgi:nicotinate phosphoribosyltransferase